MPTIIFVHQDSQRQPIEIDPGHSVMRGAVDNGINEILAECGGNCMCATCHVYVDAGQLGLLSPMTAEEDALLDGVASDRRANSRLSCQLQVTLALDGLVVHLPARQT